MLKKTHPQKKSRYTTVLLFLSLVIGLSLPAFTEPFQIDIDLPKVITTNTEFTVELTARDEEGDVLADDSTGVLLIISKWQDRQVHEVQLEDGKGLQSLTLNHMGNWIATVRKGDKIYYSGRIRVNAPAGDK